MVHFVCGTIIYLPLPWLQPNFLRFPLGRHPVQGSGRGHRARRGDNGTAPQHGPGEEESDVRWGSDGYENLLLVADNWFINLIEVIYIYII